MARMTATDFVSFTRKRMGNPSSDDWSDAEILRFCNMAVERLAQQYQPAELLTSETVTTAAGTADYELTNSDVLTITHCLNTTSGQRMKRGNHDDWIRRMQGDTTAQGDPYRWYVYGVGSNDRKNVRFEEVPDGVYSITVYYIKIPGEMVLTPNATSPDIPQQFDEAILDVAAEIGRKMDTQLREAQTERALAAKTEGVAGAADKTSAEVHRYIESPIAQVTRRE